MIQRMRRRFAERDTVDAIALLFALTVCITILIAAVGVVGMAVAGRVDEVDRAVELVSQVVASIVLVLLGMVAGRGSRAGTNERHADTES